MNRTAHVLLALTLCLIGITASGCVALGAAASKLPPPTVPAAYDGLAGQTAAVWVWVDPAADLDYPTLSLEVATAVQKRIETARDLGSRRQRKQVEGTSFPYPPSSIVRYQKQDPALNALPIRELAPRIGVERVLYVEVADFTTNGGAVSGLLRGVAELNINLVETDGRPATATRPATGEPAKIAFVEQGIRVSFPPKGPSEGSNLLNERQVYAGTVDAIAAAVADRFLPHASEE